MSLLDLFAWIVLIILVASALAMIFIAAASRFAIAEREPALSLT